jgi:hypothetical protein
MKEFDKNDYRVLMNYVRYIRENCKITPMIRPFQFYTYDYEFDKEIRPYEEIRFWDMKPLVFIFDAYKYEHGVNYVGINFHHIPVISRQIWLARIKKLQGTKFENNQMLRMKYQHLWKMFIKATNYATRQYRAERMSKVRKIDNSQMDEVMRFYGNTYYGATYSNIIANYKRFRPNIRK